MSKKLFARIARRQSLQNRRSEWTTLAALKWTFLVPLIVVLLVLLVGGGYVIYPLASEIWNIKNEKERLEREQSELESFLVSASQIEEQWSLWQEKYAAMDAEIPHVADAEVVYGELENLFREEQVSVVALDSRSMESKEDDKYREAVFNLKVQAHEGSGTEALKLFLQNIEEFDYPLDIAQVTLRREESEVESEGEGEGEGEEVWAGGDEEVESVSHVYEQLDELYSGDIEELDGEHENIGGLWEKAGLKEPLSIMELELILYFKPESSNG